MSYFLSSVGKFYINSQYYYRQIAGISLSITTKQKHLAVEETAKC